MAGRTARSVEKERYWREVIDGWRRSGGSVREWCSEQHVSEPSFYSWRRVLTERDAAAVSQPAGGQNSGQKPAQTTMLPVEIMPIRSQQEPAPLEITFAGGTHLLVRAHCQAALLREVLAVLRPEHGEAGAC
jgi:hypothetical protein